MWVCRSNIPGITYIPVASITRSPVGRSMRPRRSAVTGSKAIISVIMFPSITMSYGPAGGPPWPGITIAPRITRRLYGPAARSPKLTGVMVAAAVDGDCAVATAGAIPLKASALTATRSSCDDASRRGRPASLGMWFRDVGGARVVDADPTGDTSQTLRRTRLIYRTGASGVPAILSANLRSIPGSEPRVLLQHPGPQPARRTLEPR